MYAAGCFAQRFEAAEQGIIRTQTGAAGYTTVKINSEALQDELNRFDKENPYTYLQVIRDEKRIPINYWYKQIFTERSFSWGLSNNLAAIFQQKQLAHVPCSAVVWKK